MRQALIIGLLIMIIGVAVYVFMQQSDDSTTEDVASTDTTQQSEELTPPPTENDELQVAEYTAEQVAEHSTADDCWTIIDGRVYELTSYIEQHPGGTEILRACGGDGTSLFNERKTSVGESVGSGQPHSEFADSLLETFLVGTLAQ